MIWIHTDFSTTILKGHPIQLRVAVVVKTGKTSVLPWFCRIECGGGGSMPHWYGGLTCLQRRQQRWRCPCNSSSDITLYIVWHWFDILYVFRAQLERIMEKCRVSVVSYCWILHYVNRYVVHMCIEWVTWKQPIQIQHMYLLLFQTTYTVRKLKRHVHILR